MVNVLINGIPHDFPEGLTILQALQQVGLTVPSLCHDPRLKPIGSCRLCQVQIDGGAHLRTACDTLLREGMQIATHTTEIESVRRGILQMLARTFPQDAADDSTFAHWLKQYDVLPGGEEHEPLFSDTTHPYFRADLSRCILCQRCVDICADVQGQDIWQMASRGERMHLVVGENATSLREAGCVSCGACVDTCPTGALQDWAVVNGTTPDTWTRTVCAYCGVGCELEAGTKDGRITQVRPVMDAPVNKGHLCVKGRYAFDFVHAPDRITTPLLRKNGVWEKASWDEALDHVAVGLKHIRDQHGPDTIGILGSARATNEENYLAQKFARVVMGTHNVDSCARVCHTPTAAAMKAMLGTGAATNSFDDIEGAGLFFLVGTNTTENHPIVGARIRQCVRAGVPLIVVDPRRTELAAIAQVHLQIHPGTNIPLFHSMAHVIFSENLADEHFLATRVEDVSDYRSFVKSYSPERVAEICGVSAQSISAAARLYARTKPAMCFHGLGVTEHTQGTEGVMALVNLALITGNMGKVGSGINPLRGQNNVQGAAHMGCDPSILTGSVSIKEAGPRFEKIWGTKLSPVRGLNLLQMMDAAHTGKLKALWVMGYDVYLSLANESHTRAALEKIELVIVQDLFMNETARAFGKVFLPVASAFEKDGTFMNSERRIQRVREVLPPPGGARTDWQIICDVAARMGHAHGFEFSLAQQIWEEIRTVWPLGAGITYERIAVQGLQWPCLDESDPGTQILHQEKFAHAPHARLQCIPFTPTPEQVNTEYPFILNTGRCLYHFNAGTMSLRTRNRDLHRTDFLEMSPADAYKMGIGAGEVVRIISRYGQTELPVDIGSRVRDGELFATFHDPATFVNSLTSPYRDGIVLAPEFKVTAVRVEKRLDAHPH